MVYDLVVVGNGVAAQTFLLELFSQLELDVKKSQNYSVAQIYSEDIAPACSLRSTATVSLSGIEEGISELGDDLRNAFFAFENFLKIHKPLGVEKVKQLITYSTSLEKEKLERRYKELQKIKHPKFPSVELGIELDSYLVSPKLYSDWFSEKLKTKNIIKNKSFLKNVLKNDDATIDCHLINGEIIKTRKVVFCTGAYTKIFSQFFTETCNQSSTQVLSGSYLERSIDLKCPSFLMTIDGHNLVYRDGDKTLSIGSVSKKGAFFITEHLELSQIFNSFKERLSFDLGNYYDYKKVVGLRHKAQKRKPVARALDIEKSVYLISGFYKNGFSFSHLFAKKMALEIINQ